ncbi:hypothetical protein GCM10010424_69970 [Streptomyces lienomycini]
MLDLVVPLAHPLAHRRQVTVAELAGMDFVDSPRGYGNRTVTDRAFADASVARRVAVEITDVATGVDFVRHGLGVALLPRFVLGNAADVATLTVSDANLEWPLSLALPAERAQGAATRAMIAMARELLSRPRSSPPPSA